MERHGNGRSRGAGTLLVLTVLLISGFADGTGDHEQPRSQVREAVPRFGKPGAASQAVSTSRLESGLGNTGSALPQQDARRQSKDFPARDPKLIGFEPPVSDFAERYSAEAEHTWRGVNDQPSWTGGAIESLPSSFDGARFNLSTSLSGAVEVVLPFGEEEAEEMVDSEIGNDFRLFGSLTMKF